MAQVSGFDRARRARTMAYLSAGEDAGEVAGPIVAGLLWSTFGVPVLLAVRIGAAVVTEVYTVLLTSSLHDLETDAHERHLSARPPPVRRRALARSQR